MCVAFLPVAVVPLWQLAQLPCTCVWSTRSRGLEDNGGVAVLAQLRGRDVRGVLAGGRRAVVAAWSSRW